jgi:anti-sigma regulatory factor (Ser/Thr protein kinase)
MDPLRVPARLDALGTIGAYVVAASESGGLDKRAAYGLRMAVDEIATNIIMHGRPGEHGNEIIVIKAEIDDESVRIVLEDGGPAFNPLEKADPADLHLPAEDRQMGGLGVFLALRSVDKFEYDRVGSINRNTLVVRRRSLKTAGTC